VVPPETLGRFTGSAARRGLEEHDAAGITAKLLGRIGTRPIFVASTLITAGGVYAAPPCPPLDGLNRTTAAR
jgi:hypothetical protein